MSTRDVDRLLTTWLAADAPAREPDHLLEAVLATTSRTRRRPGWLIPERWFSMQLTMRWRPMPALGPVVAVIALVIALAIAIIIAGSPPRLPSPFGLAANGRIITGMNGDLFIRDAIDGPDRLLVAGPASDFGPSFANDGTRFAFFRMVDAPADRMELWVGRPDGSDVHRLAEFTAMESYRWSPDGSVIAVTSGPDQAWTLSFVEVASGRVTAVDLEFPVSQPIWRPPDGRQLLVRGLKDGAWGFLLIDRQGAVVSSLALDEGFQDDPHYDENVWAYFLDPTWSPDGSKLMFHTLEPTTVNDSPGWRVYLADVSPDGAIADAAMLPTDAVIDDVFEGRWLPDGSGLVVRTLDQGTHRLVLHRLDGTTPRDLGLEVRPAAGGDFGYVISPDGRQAIAISVKPDHAWRIDLTAGSPEEIDLTAEEWPAWQRLAP
jgi:Tol biopolymer transport system component